MILMLKHQSGAQCRRTSKGPILETTLKMKHSIRLIPPKISITQEWRGTRPNFRLRARIKSTCHHSTSTKEDLSTIPLATNWAIKYFNRRDLFFPLISLTLLLTRMKIATLKLTNSILSHIHIKDLESKMVKSLVRKIE